MLIIVCERAREVLPTRAPVRARANAIAHVYEGLIAAAEMRSGALPIRECVISCTVESNYWAANGRVRQPGNDPGRPEREPNPAGKRQKNHLAMTIRLAILMDRGKR
jgi:hypothetical protein